MLNKKTWESKLSECQERLLPVENLLSKIATDFNLKTGISIILKDGKPLVTLDAEQFR
jgi:hypothetical protein